jgi:hypothetical protein
MSGLVVTAIVLVVDYIAFIVFLYAFVPSIINDQNTILDNFNVLNAEVYAFLSSLSLILLCLFI